MGVRYFAELFQDLDHTTKTSAKEAALRSFFDRAPDSDVIHGVHALLGKRDDAPASTTNMKDAVKSVSDVSDWLYQECYDAVGDTAETISLLINPDQSGEDRTITGWYRELRRLDRAKSYQKKHILGGWYRSQDPLTVFLVNKLITGAFRVGVSQKTVVNALSDHTGVDTEVLLHRLIGDWEPTTSFYRQLCSEPSDDELAHKPFPFFLCYPVDEPSEELGSVESYAFEWKYDGIRAQALCRDDVSLWSRSGEPITGTFPELSRAARRIDQDVVLDGEILAYDDGEPMSFQELQRRLGRSNPSQKLQNDVPVIFVVYDVLEIDGDDVRGEELQRRRGRLSSLNLPERFDIADQRFFESWGAAAEAMEGSRSHGVEGFMVKHVRSVYHAGRKKKGWWKWKLDPFVIDAVLMYAQTGHGKRSGLYTDYTFGVWDGDELVPIAKAYSGLTDEVFEDVDRWIRGNTVQSFGPVREVKKEKVFEIAFQGIYENSDKKSGYATRFPRIQRLREDKDAEEADTVERCAELVDSYG